MGEYKTPGVYIKEKNAFGNSIVEALLNRLFVGFTGQLRMDPCLPLEHR